MPTDGDFVLHADVKTWLGIGYSSEDDFLDQAIAGVESAIRSHTGRYLSEQTLTEYYNGHGGEFLVLRQRPLTAVPTSVHVHSTGYGGHGDSAFPASTEWVNGSDYFPESTDADEHNSGMLVAVHGVWPTGKRNIKVVYTAGYSTIPDDLKQATYQLIAAVRNGRREGVIKGGETLGRYAYQLLAGGSAQSGVVTARNILAGYCDPVL